MQALRCLHFLVGACIALGLSGCGWANTRRADSVEPALAAALAQHLDADHWQRRSDDTTTPRWQFGITPLEAEAVFLQSALPDNLTVPDDKTEIVTSRQPSADLGSRSEQSPLRVQVLAALRTLANRDDRVGWNALVLWSQRKPLDELLPVTRLADLVAGKSGDLWGFVDAAPQRPSESLRAAAAESWCRRLATLPGDPFDHFAAAGRLLEDPELPAEVRFELWRGLARRVPPVAIPGLDDALPAQVGDRRVLPEARRAALEACLVHARNAEGLPPSGLEKWPRTLLSWAENGASHVESDPQMRQMFGRWLATVGHPHATAVLHRHLTDTDPAIRSAAMLSLGVVGDAAALALLEEQARRSEPTVRATAVRALANWGVRALAPYVDDASHEVRRAVAESLSEYPELTAANLLLQLQADRSLDVEQAVITAITNWPDQWAVPVLLFGLEHSTVTTRRLCRQALSQRLGTDVSFPETAGAARRAEAVRELAARWQLPTTFAGTGLALPVSDASAQNIRIEELQADLITVTDPQCPPQSPEVRDALARLRQMLPADVAVVESFLAQPSTPGQRIEVLEREVLPAVAPVYAALLELEFDDLARRRRAAQKLAALGESRSLRPYAVRRLGDRLTFETDEFVWRSAFRAVWRDRHDETQRIVRLAANHPSAAVRRLACEYAVEHPAAAHGEWLLPLLRDSDKLVQLAAVDAAGRCRNRHVVDGGPDDPRPSGLRALLHDSDAQIRFAAAVALSRYGDAQGLDELTRLSWHPDAVRRREVILAMGDTGQARFIEHLIRLAAAETDGVVQRVALTSLDRLVPAENRPAAVGEQSTTNARIAAWVKWAAP